jgi:hypothetical protein
MQLKCSEHFISWFRNFRILAWLTTFWKPCQSGFVLQTFSSPLCRGNRSSYALAKPWQTQSLFFFISNWLRHNRTHLRTRSKTLFFCSHLNSFVPKTIILLLIPNIVKVDASNTKKKHLCFTYLAAIIMESEINVFVE